MGCADSTDRHILRGEYPARLPVTLGPGCAGEVAATGAEAALPVGTRIAVDPNIACGICHECRRGTCACARGAWPSASIGTVAWPTEPGAVKAMVMP
jgi:threonine dehydrogenase-like Zn-dependent dehydrogenase